jgi:Protein of unknown function (DUF3455)
MPHSIRHPYYFRREALGIGASALLAVYGCATQPPPPPTANESLPADLRAAPTEVLQEIMTATGDQTYICRRTPSAAIGAGVSSSDGGHGTQLLWTEVGSEATLVDSARQSAGTVVPGHHFLAYDGSSVTGTPVAEHQIDANMLTWVRYKAKNVATPRPGEGRFAGVTSIQRIDTKGGLPPQPVCTVEGTRLLVPYGATYMIYREQGHAPLAQPPGTDTGKADFSSTLAQPAPAATVTRSE